MPTRIRTTLAMLALTAFGIGVTLAQQGPPGAAGGPPRGGGNLVPMLVESAAFPDGGIIPPKFSLYGGSTQPDFRITAMPAATQSVAIIFHDLDVALGGNTEDNLHWLAWNIPVSGGSALLAEGKLPEGAVGRSPRGAVFLGPGAPNSPRYHHYVFEFYALNAKLDLPATASRAELLAAMQGKVVGKAAYFGRFRNDASGGTQAAGSRSAP